MKMNKLLTKRELLFLLKYYKINDLNKVGMTENVTGERVRQIVSHALRKIRQTTKLTSKNDQTNFDSASLITSMARAGGMDGDSFEKTLTEWLVQGLGNETNHVYYEQIPHKGICPTPIELFDFIQGAYKEKLFT